MCTTSSPNNRGRGLWEPNLCSGDIGLADVGYIRKDGTFLRLFNASKAGDDPINRHGLPSGHEPCVADSILHSTSLPDILSKGTSEAGSEMRFTVGYVVFISSPLDEW